MENELRLKIPKFRRYSSPSTDFYLSKGVVEIGDNELVDVCMWSADKFLRALEKQYKAADNTFRRPNLYQTFLAARVDDEMKEVVFDFPAKLQSTLILPGNAQVETDEYILVGADGNAIPKSKRARSFEPAKRYKESGKQIIAVKGLFDIPFKLVEDSQYNPEDLNPETGFLTQLTPGGQYPISFGIRLKKQLYCIFLMWGGTVRCGWGPWDSHDTVGFQVAVDSQTGSPLELPKDSFDTETASSATKGNRDKIIEILYRIEAGYESDIERLQADLETLRELRRNL